MSDETDQKPSEPAALVEPTEPPRESVPENVVYPAVATDPAVTTEPATVSEHVVDDGVVAEPVQPTADPTEVVVADPAPPVVAPPVADPVAAQPSVLYVEAPHPPRAKGNRGFGILIALVSTVVFAALYAVTLLIVELIRVGSSDLSFVSTTDFWVPVVAFAIGFIILVVIVNRAGWAAHVLGSLFVGVFVYFASGGALLIIHAHQIVQSEVPDAFQAFLFSTGAIAAALLAREVSLWVGFAIAARGRRVKVRNLEARESYDREFAAKRAEYERANSSRTDVANTYPLADS